MTTDFAGDPSTFPALITTPSDGEDRDANSVQVPLEQLADRTANMVRANGISAAKNWSGSEVFEVTSGTTHSIRDMVGVPGHETRSWHAVGNDNSNGSATHITASHGAHKWGNGVITGTAFDAHGITYDSTNDLVIVCGAGGTIRTDPGTAAWTDQTVTGSTLLRAVHTNSAGVTISAGDHDGTDIFAVRATNGTTYSAISLAGSAGDQVNRIVSNGATFVAVGETSGGAPLIWRSTDSGATWSVITIPSGITTELVGLVYDGNVFMIHGDPSEAATSATGATGSWTVVAGCGFSIQAMASDYINNITLVLPLATTVPLITTDAGVTWARLAHGIASWQQSIGIELKAMAFDGTCFGAAGASSGTAPDTFFGAQSLVL